MAAKKQSPRVPPKREKRQLSVHVDQETLGQLEELRTTLKGTYSSIIGQAIARWYHEEPLLRSKIAGKKANGQLTEGPQ